MNLILNNLRIPVEDGKGAYLKAVSQKLGLPEADVHIVKILYESLDIEDKEQFFFKISLVVKTPESFANKDRLPVYTEEPTPVRKAKNTAERPVIIGFGPAGIFAALELVAYGLKPIIFERGKKVEERGVDVQRFRQKRVLNLESNIQFGEGGAGNYSDGKIFSRRSNTRYISQVLDTFIKFGAPEKIGYMSKPHIGTDILGVIVRNVRNYILERGAEIHYSSKMTDLLIKDGAVAGIVINGEKEFLCSSVYLAVGHSARDTFEMLYNKGIALEQKAISIGTRLEHPAEVINRMRYGDKYKDFSFNGQPAYSMNHTDRKKKRGVYTFCMCPGGEVVNASSEQGMVVVNGMSYSQRGSRFSNGGIVVTCRIEDYGSDHPLAGVEFQKEIERAAFEAGGGTFEVPAQNLTDFLSGKVSNKLNENSCATGTKSADMRGVFPAAVTDALVSACAVWKEGYPEFISDSAIVIGAETRTSSPVKITRNEGFESVSVKKLYPIGEGSGNSGGISSSAADAIRAVEAVLGAE